ncbi:MAG TPA: hypothetical protein VF171_05395, partial [Trueperaceae bacterium]
MTNDHKYSLTRVCLRMGQMSLSQAMLELFPEEGVITALDTDKGNEFDVRMEGRRTVTGLQDFYRSHHLAVNDQVLIRKLDDGRFALTPLPRPKRAEAQRDMPADRLVDRLLEMGSPLSEPEIRAAFPNLPRDLDLPALLGRDGRLVKKEGRWRKVNRQTSEDPAHHQNAGEHLELPERAGVPPHANRADQAGPGSPPRRATVTPYPRGVMFPGSAGLNSAQEPTEDPALQVRVRDALQAFGFRAEGLSHGQLIARADMGRRQYSVLVHPHAQEGRLDWAALLQRRRQT